MRECVEKSCKCSQEAEGNDQPLERVMYKTL